MYEPRFAENLIDVALESGASVAELYISDKTETEITVAEGRTEAVTVRTNCGFGLRVLVESKLGFYSSNRFDTLAAIENVRKMVTATQHHSQDPYNVIPLQAEPQTAGVTEVHDPQLSQIPLARKVQATLEMERAGKAEDPRMAGFVWVQYGDTVEHYRVVNSAGIDVSSLGTMCYGFAYGFAQDRNKVQTGKYHKAWGHFHEFDAEKIGRKAAAFAVRMLGATEFPTSTLPALFPPEAGVPLVHAIFRMVEADSVQKGKTPFRDRMGKPVASSLVTIIDDGTLPGGLASRPYDSEGIPTTRTLVIDRGILRNYLYDAYTAKKGGTHSTGNASRSSYHSKPGINPTNFYLEPQTDSAPLLSRIPNGIMITELEGLHAGINHTTADFSVAAKGILIRGGAPVQPVENIAISGNLFDFLSSICAIGDDLTFIPMDGMVGAPSFCVEGLKVIGRG